MAFTLRISMENYFKEPLDQFIQWVSAVRTEVTPEGKIQYFVMDEHKFTVDPVARKVNLENAGWRSSDCIREDHSDSAFGVGLYINKIEGLDHKLRAMCEPYAIEIANSLRAVLPAGLGKPEVQSNGWITAAMHLERKAKQDLQTQGLIKKNIYDLAKDLFGADEYGLELSKYNWVWLNWDGIQEVRHKAPGAFYFLENLYKQDKDKRYGDYDDEGNWVQTVAPNCDPETGRYLNLLGTLKTFILDCWKLTKGDWKLITGLSLKHGKWLKRDGPAVGLAIALQAVREGDRFPKVTAMQAIERFLRDNDNRLRAMKNRVSVTRAKTDPTVSVLQLMCYTALLAGNDAPNIKNWVKLEFEQVTDWFVAEGHQIIPDKNQQKPTRNIEIRKPDGTSEKKTVNAWRWFVQKSDQWHEERARNAHVSADDRRKSWSSPLAAHVHGDYMFIPMLTAEDLIIEGNVMVHCVGSSPYINPSLQGEKLIWSVRDMEGNRLATFEIKAGRNEDGSVRDTNKNGSPTIWSYGQMRGKRNADMNEQLKKPCEAMLDRFNKVRQDAWLEVEKLRKEAEEAERVRKREEKTEQQKQLTAAGARDGVKRKAYQKAVKDGIQGLTEPEYELPALKLLFGIVDKPKKTDTPAADAAVAEVPEMPTVVTNITEIADHQQVVIPEIPEVHNPNPEQPAQPEEELPHAVVA